MAGRRLALSVVAAAGVAALGLLVVAAVPEGALVARGVLAGVFLMAGIAKLRDRVGFAKVLGHLGLRGFLQPLVAVGLPVFEIAVAAVLLMPLSATAAGLGALALLLVLTGVVLAALVQARSVDCGCFGEDHSAPLGASTLLRNGALAGLAGGIVLAGSAAQEIASSAGAGSLVAAGCAALVIAAMSAVRSRGTAPSQPEAGLAIMPAGTTVEPPVTRRGLIRAAGGAGAAGALGAWLGWLDSPTADAVGSRGHAVQSLTCENCVCCPGQKSCLFGVCVCFAYCCPQCQGFTGGGVVQTASGTAQASFFGDRSQLKGSRQVVIGGLLSWFDAGWNGTGLLLQSTRITSYRRIPGTDIRELVGLASANGSGKHKFVLRVVDSAQPGSGSDTVELTVNGVAAGGAGGGGSQYAASGHLAQGDITTKLQATVEVK